MSALRIAVLDADVLSLDPSEVAETEPECLVRGALSEREYGESSPIRRTFAGACASALAPHTVNATTIAKSPAHFRFWIADFRLSEREPDIFFEETAFTSLFSCVSIQNLKPVLSSYRRIEIRKLVLNECEGSCLI